MHTDPTSTGPMQTGLISTSLMCTGPMRTTLHVFYVVPHRVPHVGQLRNNPHFTFLSEGLSVLR